MPARKEITRSVIDKITPFNAPYPVIMLANEMIASCMPIFAGVNLTSHDKEYDKYMIIIDFIVKSIGYELIITENARKSIMAPSTNITKNFCTL